MEGLERIRFWLKGQGYDGIILSRRDNYTWITKGNTNHVVQNSEVGVAALFIRENTIDIIADSSDSVRIAKEQNSVEGNQVLVPWYESMEEFLADYLKNLNVVSDTGVAGTTNVQAELVTLRMQLTEEDVKNYQTIGIECASIVEQVCKEAMPGQTENDVANRLRILCIEHGISPDCVLVGADDRILKYRHPMPTDKRIEQSLMCVLGGEKSGLNISLTRMVYFTSVPQGVQEKYEKLRYIFASMQLVMKEGMSYSHYFEKVVKLYEEAGYKEEWKLHHQGGPTGYDCREFVVKPSNKDFIHAGQAYAWNPSITGVKCEETTFLGKNGLLTFTRTKEWPRKTIATPDGNFDVADILQR
jgi:Xaa-Pro aminopeptidase